VNVDETSQVLQELILFGQKASEAGLMDSTCGNASIRHGAEHMAISGSGSALAKLAPEDVCIVSLEDGSRVSGPPPSMESELHRQCYRARPAIGAILHCQSRAATLLACRVDPPQSLDFIPEVSAYVRAHAYVPFALPGSDDLARGVGDALADPDVTVIQMVNHGQVVVGATAGKVVRRATFFELACWMATQDSNLQTIPPDAVRALRDYARDV